VTLGPWAARDEAPIDVLATHREAVVAIAAARLPASLSVKLPELAYDERLFAELLAWAAEHRVAVHLDSLRPDTATRTFACLREVVADHPDIGCTLPGRWSRSVRDAEAVLDMGVRSVRVVKGQWEDPAEPKRNPARGVLEVIDALRGGGAEVGVATHDEPLAAESIGRLLASQTGCRLEQLYGFPRLDVGLWRRRFGLGYLVYVPYGQAYLPYALTQALRHPKILTWVARDLVGRRQQT
jgi:proline dehydrogenase